MKKQLLLVSTMCLFLGIAQVSAQDNDFDVTIEEEKPKLIDRGGKGAYGTSLSKLANFVSLNGFAANDILFTDDEVSFRQNTVNLFVTGELSSKLTTEFNIGFEEGGGDVEIEYAFLDYQFNRAATVRVGKFLLPTSDFNEYSWLPYINRMNDRHLSSAASPDEWSSVGIQLRGKLGAENANIQPFYAVYVVNGLQSGNEDAEETEEGINSELNELAEGGEIGEDNNKAKDFGAQFGVEFGNGFTVSTYYHLSKYDSAEELGAGIWGISGSYDNGKLYVAGEFHTSTYDEADEDDPSEIEEEEVSGYFLMAGYKLNDKWEPTFRYDAATIEEVDITRITGGINYYFGDTRLVKMNVGQLSVDGGEDETFYELGVVFSF